MLAKEQCVKAKRRVALHALTNTRPDDPLRVLGEYLIQRSKEIEGSI